MLGNPSSAYGWQLNRLSVEETERMTAEASGTQQ